MNKTQQTLYFWFKKLPEGGVFLNTFECDGKPNVKLVFDVKKNKVKSLCFQDGGKLIKEEV